MRVLPPYGETCTAVFCMQRGVVKHDAPQGVGKTPSPLPLRPPVAGLVPFLAGQLVGGLAEPFNGFQFFQIPGRRVIEDQFPAVTLLEQFPLLRLHLGKLLMDSLVLVVLRPHLPALGECGNPALGFDDLSPQVIVGRTVLRCLYVRISYGSPSAVFCIKYRRLS